MKGQLMSDIKPADEAQATTLEALVAKTCFCKLRTFCEDKSSDECLKHKNIYAEFMQEKKR